MSETFQRKPSQVPLSNLLYGSIFFVVIAAVACVVGNVIVGRKSRDRLSKFENRR